MASNQESQSSGFVLCDDVRDNGRKKVLVIGKTGVGKSSLCNVLAGLRPSDTLFGVSDASSSCTQHTSFADVFLNGEVENPISVIDSVGFSDCNKEDDAQVIAELVHKLKTKCDFINTIVIALDGNNPRLDASLKGMIKIFQTMFGKSFWDHTLIVFSKIPMDKKQISKRLKHTGRMDMDRADDYVRDVESMFEDGKDLKSIFLDAHFDSDDDEEKAHFQEGIKNLREHIFNSPNLETARVTQIQEENARLREIILMMQLQNKEVKKPFSKDDEEVFLRDGSFGRVYSKGQYQVKKISHTGPQANNEIELLKKLKNTFIIQFITSYTEGAQLVIVTENADMGTFKEDTTKFAHDVASVYFKEYSIWRLLSALSNGLSYLHAQNILHRDITTETVLGVTEWDEAQKSNATYWKLSNVGVARMVTEEALEQYYGSATHIPPEVMRDYKQYNYSSDIWSLGLLIVYCMNLGVPLFTTRDQVLDWKGLQEDTIRTGVYSSNIRKLVGRVLHKQPSIYSSSLRELVGRMLHPQPDLRPTAQQIDDETWKDDRMEIGKH